MAACPYGASPKPGIPLDTEVWLDKSDLPPEIIEILTLFIQSAWASITAQLVNPIGICSENPDPPQPINVLDIIGFTGGVVPPPTQILGSLLIKVYSWLRYAQFLTWCECNPPPTTPGNNCADPPVSFPLGSLGSIAGPFPITVDQAVLDSWPVQPGGGWSWGFDGRAIVSGAATDGNNLDIQIQAIDGSWIPGPDLQALNAQSGVCRYPLYQASVPRFGTNTAIRIVNNAGGTYTISELDFCFCPSVLAPPSLPTQPPLDGVPAPPPLLCGTEDLCGMITELAHRLTVIAGQVSDIQAALTSSSTYSVLDEMTMPLEGQRTLVLGTRAVSVELTDLPDGAYTSALGNPRGLMRVGSLRWWDGIGYSPRRFIDADRYDENRPPGALAVSWQLLPGAQAILKMLG